MPAILAPTVAEEGIAHGAQDQLFPVAYIRLVVDKLREWGHNVTYHELAGFGHAYPPGENTPILDWFEGLRHSV